MFLTEMIKVLLTQPGRYLAPAAAPSSYSQASVQTQDPGLASKEEGSKESREAFAEESEGSCFQVLSMDHLYIQTLTCSAHIVLPCSNTNALMKSLDIPAESHSFISDYLSII